MFCYPHRWDSLSYYANRADVTAFDRDRRDDLIRALGDQPQSLLFVQTHCLPEILADLPPDLEFVQRQQDGGVTVGEVRRKREAPVMMAKN